MELIRELREDERLAEEKEAADVADAEADAAKYLQSVRDATLDTVQGEVAAATLDYMAKELVRTAQAERLNAHATDAFRVRRVREAEESGRRQAEENVRARQDLVYRQLQRVHNQTADSYVDELLAKVVDQGKGKSIHQGSCCVSCHVHTLTVLNALRCTAAAARAEKEMYLKKHTIIPAVDAAEQELNGGEVVVRDLVASFLMPEVERQKVQEQGEEGGKRQVAVCGGQ